MEENERIIDSGVETDSSHGSQGGNGKVHHNPLGTSPNGHPSSNFFDIENSGGGGKSVLEE